MLLKTFSKQFIAELTLLIIKLLENVFKNQVVGFSPTRIITGYALSA